jgi:hypothetical protein
MWPLLLLLVGAGRGGAEPPDQYPVNGRPAQLTIGANSTVRWGAVVILASLESPQDLHRPQGA